MSNFDLIVIGAGIHGAAVAKDAINRGMSVAVVEAREAAGLETSSASSKLIHGGLRYLETAQIKLVYECLSERRYLINNYPELVKLKRFVIPVYQSSGRSPIIIFLGLFLYWVLSGCRGSAPWPMAKSKWRNFGFKKEGLKAIYTYLDAQTDDQKLTQKLIQEAQAGGAQCYFNEKVKSLRGDSGYTLTLNSGEQIRSHFLVNSAGPWVNEVALLLGGDFPDAPISWVQGTHIVLDCRLSEDCIYCESPEDGRAVFILPWQGKTMVGTTERVLREPQASASDAEVQYLLNVVNHYFTEVKFDESNIVEQFSGIRVLPGSDVNNKNANKTSRETVFKTFPESKTSYVGIYGGKLTSHRVTAKKALDLLDSSLGG